MEAVMKKIEVLILIALPASGKSEVMKFLQTRTPADLAQLHLGLPSHLDDYPYVEIMRKVDETAMKMLRMEPLFFHSLDRGFKDPYEWITLIELLNEDFRCYEEGDARSADAEFLFHRIDMAELRAGARMKLGRLPNDIRKLLAQHLAASVKEKEKKFELNCLHQVATKEKTAIVEFSRGAAIDAPLPLDPPYGYRFALSRLDPSILERAAILYIKVSPEESRCRNAERAVPPPGCTDTTLFHGVPTEVMLRDYGRDDFAEMFPSSETLVPGDVVVFSDENIHVKRSTQKNEKSIAGIVSTRPGFLAGENTPGSYPIALAGRVPTNVNNENGAIAVGDPLTTSSVSGAAMKATEAGPIVGYALEPFDGTEGSITVFVSAGYWGGDATSSTPGTDNRASLFGASGNSSMSTLSMGGNINMNGNEISNIGRMAGLTNSWSIEMDGTIKTEALLKTVITGQNNQKVETIATTSPEAVITLSGSSTLKEGMAEVRFFDINKDFGNVISAIAPIRVVATPNGPVSLYVSEKDQNHFVVKSFGGNASDVEFDWVVTGYRKGFEPVVEETPSVTAEVSTPTEPTATEVAPVETSSEPNAPASAQESSTNTQTQPEASPSDVPASSPSASTTIVDPSVTDADASASTSSP